jgi:hypothetical protein
VPPGAIVQPVERRIDLSNLDLDRAADIIAGNRVARRPVRG